MVSGFGEIIYSDISSSFTLPFSHTSNQHGQEGLTFHNPTEGYASFTDGTCFAKQEQEIAFRTH